MNVTDYAESFLKTLRSKTEEKTRETDTVFSQMVQAAVPIFEAMQSLSEQDGADFEVHKSKRIPLASSFATYRIDLTKREDSIPFASVRFRADGQVTIQTTDETHSFNSLVPSGTKIESDKITEILVRGVISKGLYKMTAAL